MKRFIIFVTVLGFAVTAFAGNWSCEYCQDAKVKESGAGFVVKFPSGSGHVNLIGRDQKALPANGTISVTYRIRGDGKFHSLDTAQGLNPNFRPMLFNGDWFDNNGRWWPTGANCAWLVADNAWHTYSVKLSPKLWSNVYGKQGAAQFKACLKKLKRLYLAFGGGNSFSHGVTDGGAVLEVKEVSVK